MTSRRQDRGGARWIYGINAVQRRVEVRPESVIEIHVLRRPSGRLAHLARTAEGRIPLRYGDAEHLRRLTGTAAHQGVAARTGPFQYRALEAAVSLPRGALLVLDQVQDPHNFGALLRTAAAAGVRAVVIPRHGCVGVTPTVEKVAAGAANDVAVCPVSNLSRVLRWVRGQGFWRVGLAPTGGDDLFEMDAPGPVALVLGGEGGLRPLTLSLCDIVVSIPMNPGVESLNASVAGAVAMYELRRKGLLDRPK